MKKIISILVAAMLMAVCVLMFAGCNETENPGTPPENIVNNSATQPGNDNDSPGNASLDDRDVLENAVSIRIGRGGQEEFSINMYDSNAVNTMLNYLSSSALLFPTYTYSDEDGFVGQTIRGSYTREDEISVENIKAGELYLFSGGQLRLYFKDIQGANITATPVGYAALAAKVSTEIPAAYQSNLNDSWGVDVYFWITKHI